MNPDDYISDEAILGEIATTEAEKNKVLRSALKVGWKNKVIVRIERKDTDQFHGWYMWSS